MSSHNIAHKSPTARSSDRIPTVRDHHPSPISPIYACALQKLYQKEAYNCFYATKPYCKTKTDVEICEPGGLRYRSPSNLRTWKDERGPNMRTYSKDPRGVLQNQKIEAHGMQEVYWNDARVFPRTWVMERLESEEKLYPQYGELKSNKLCEEQRCSTHKTSKLRQKNSALPVGFQPFLMCVFTSSTVTKSALPPPWCDMSERTFQDWFVRNMTAIGVSVEFSHTRLSTMRREEDKQRWAAAESEELSSKEMTMMHNILPRGALLQILATTVEPEEPEEPEEKSAMALEIEEHLKCIAEAKKARRYASRSYAAREQRSVGTAKQSSKNETSFVQKLKTGLREFWIR